MAALAGAAVGGFEDVASAVTKMASVRKVFMPDVTKGDTYAALYKKYANLYQAIKGL